MQCCSACSSRVGCVSWTFWAGQNCNLFKTVSAKAGNGDCTSGTGSPAPPAPPPPHPDPGRWNPPAHGPVCKGCPNIIFSLTDDQDVALGGWYVNFGIPFGGTLFLSFSTLYYSHPHAPCGIPYVVPRAGWILIGVCDVMVLPIPAFRLGNGGGDPMKQTKTLLQDDPNVRLPPPSPRRPVSLPLSLPPPSSFPSCFCSRSWCRAVHIAIQSAGRWTDIPHLK